jgi:cyclopropane fatty-acyl-phospholipid synthase-like methyltransferase
MNYHLAYRIGFHPWEESIDNPDYVEQLGKLLSREEEGRTKPFGRALDIGTGSGIWGIELAKRGWNVTGVDYVERALERAKKRVAEAGVEVKLMNGDVTKLRDDGVEGPFDLVLDTGTFHGLKPDQQKAMGREVSALAAPDATILLIAWQPRFRPVINIKGVTKEGIESAFEGWKVTDVESANFKLPKPLEVVLKPNEQWFRLKRA